VRKRRSARIILRDAAGAALLIEFVVTRGAGQARFWATPGGEVEDGETDDAAARREAHEELGLDLSLLGPVHRHVSIFEHAGERIESTDIFFVACGASAAPVLSAPTEAERAVMRSLRWWTPAQIEETAETIYPPGLAALLRRLDAGEGGDS